MFRMGMRGGTVILMGTYGRLYNIRFLSDPIHPSVHLLIRDLHISYSWSVSEEHDHLYI